MNDSETVRRLGPEILLQELSLKEPAFWCFNTGNGDGFRINETAYRFLMCFRDPSTLTEAIQQLSDICDDLPPESGVELQDFYEKCVNVGVLV